VGIKENIQKLGEAVQEIDRRNINQKWPVWKTVGTLGLLLVAGIAGFVLPFVFLGWAGDASGRGDTEGADFWKEWSFGLVSLGPALFTTSFLAMASQLPAAPRWLVRGLAVVVSGGVLWGLYEIGPEIQISVLLSALGVLYTLAADAFTPDSSDPAEIDRGSEDTAAEARSDNQSEETSGKTEAAETSVVSTSREPRGETSHVGK
jgi:hypothetical protein